MDKGFFDNHPGLGSVFDFDHDGHMNLGEAGVMAGAGALIASELLDPDGGLERERDDDSWGSGRKREADDDSDEFDDPFDDDDYGEGYIDNNDVDTSSRSAIMRAIGSDDYFGDVENLLDEALGNGVRFRPDDIIELLDDRSIHDEDLLRQLVNTSKPECSYLERSQIEMRFGGPDYIL